MKKILATVCTFALLLGCITVPLTVNAEATINSVEIKENEAYVFDFSSTASATENSEAATGDTGIGYYGWGWDIKDNEGNKALQGINVSGRTWSTGGGYRLHTKLSDHTYGFYALETSSKYVVSFKIRVLSSPVSIAGSNATNTTTLNLGYNTSYNPNASGLGSCYVNGMSTKIKVMESLIDSNTYTLYDADGKATEYPCDDTWRTVTYFINTPESFKNDNALAFYNANFHGTTYEIDDVSVTKIGADFGIISLYDEYSNREEMKLGKIGEAFTLPDISDRAQQVSHEFIGWYIDENRTQKAENITFKSDVQKLYSAWKSPVSITFVDKVNNTTSTITGIAGESFAYPQSPTYPTDEKWFNGWYTDEQYKVKHTSGAFGYVDLTLYAYFEGYDSFERMIDYSAYTVRKGQNSWSYTTDSPAYQSVVKDASATGGAYLNFHCDANTAGPWLGSYTLTLTESGVYDRSGVNNVKFPENATYKATVRMRVNELSGMQGKFFVSYGISNNNALDAAKNNHKVLLSGVKETEDFEIFELYFTTPNEYIESSDMCFLGFTAGGNVELDYDIDYILLERVSKVEFYTVENGVSEYRDFAYYQPGEYITFPIVISEEGYSESDNTAVTYDSYINAWYTDEALSVIADESPRIKNNDIVFYADSTTKTSNTDNQIGFCGFDLYEEDIEGTGIPLDSKLSITEEERSSGNSSLKAKGNGVFEVRNANTFSLTDKTTYNITFSYKADKDSKISFGLGEMYNIEKHYALAEYEVKATDTWEKVTLQMTADFGIEDYSNSAYALVGIIETEGEVYIDTLSVSSLIGGIGALKLKESVATKENTQAIRVMFTYKAADSADEIMIDGAVQTVKSRGILIKDALGSAELIKENLGNGKVFGSAKNSGMENCWSYNTVNQNLTFSNYIKNFDIDDDRKISARGYIELNDGRVFYSDIITACVKDITEGSGLEIEEGADIRNGKLTHSSATASSITSANSYQAMNDYYFYLPEGTEIRGEEFAVFCYDPFFKVSGSLTPSYVKEYVMQKSEYVRISAKGNINDLEIYVPSDVAALIEKGSKEYLSYDMEALKMSENIKIVNDGAVNYVFVTDLHHSKGASNRNDMIRQMNTLTKFANDNDSIDFVVVGGDITNGMFATKQDAIENTQDILNPLKDCNKPVFVAFGNHDDNSYHVESAKEYYPERIISDYDWSKNILDEYCPETIVKDSKYSDSKYYYYDLPEKKTRIIVLDSVDARNTYDENGVITELNPHQPENTIVSRHYKTGYSYWGYDIEQIKWLGSEAMTAEEDWNYVYLSHMGIDGAMNSYGNTMFESKYLREMIAAYQNKTVYSNETIGTFDFSQTTGKITVMSFGHQHIELIHYDEDIDLWQISTASANITAYTNGGNITQSNSEILAGSSINSKSYAWSWYYRAKGSPSEYSFDIISADENKVMKFAFGCGSDKTMYYKK